MVQQCFNKVRNRGLTVLIVQSPEDCGLGVKRSEHHAPEHAE